MSGIRVYPAIVVVQLREDLYPHPHEFRPERFIEEEATSYSRLPFGGGIRRCIGAALAQAEMAEVIRTVVSRVDLEPVRPGREPVVMRGITLVPRHGTPVQIRKRLSVVVGAPAHSPPRVQGDLENHRRNGEADQRVGDR